MKKNNNSRSNTSMSLIERTLSDIDGHRRSNTRMLIFLSRKKSQPDSIFSNYFRDVFCRNNNKFYWTRKHFDIQDLNLFYTSYCENLSMLCKILYYTRLG